MSGVSGNPVYHDGKVHVMSEKCSTCIFRPGNLMHLAPGRVKEMVTETLADEGGSITCHKTIQGQAEQQAVCRGWYDAYAEQSPTFVLAAALGIVVESCPECNGTGLIEMPLGHERCNDCVEGWVKLRG